MNKLLHERLRDGDGAFIQLKTKSFTTSFHRDLAGEIADEIEKYYIPLPRFENGEPVRFGDVFRTELGNVECVAVEYNEYNAWVKDGTDNDWNASISADEMAKIHRLPKVLDADGVEIKVGDTVWIIESGDKGKVEEINKDRVYVKCDDGWLADVHVSHITHREPDSLQRVQQLASDWAHEDNISNSSAADFRDVMEEIANRFTAIMERDA